MQTLLYGKYKKNRLLRKNKSSIKYKKIAKVICKFDEAKLHEYIKGQQFLTDYKLISKNSSSCSEGKCRLRRQNFGTHSEIFFNKQSFNKTNSISVLFTNTTIPVKFIFETK